ncbi:hypothetical protein GCM10028821_04530 [Hymenobacter jeollabukensis]
MHRVLGLVVDGLLAERPGLGEVARLHRLQHHWINGHYGLVLGGGIGLRVERAAAQQRGHNQGCGEETG